MKPLAFAILALVFVTPAHAADLVLAADGKSAYQIVVPDAAPSPAVGEALNQTARLVQTAFKANGADVPVVAEAKRDPEKPSIYLGDTAFARAQKVDLASLTGWGYFLKVVGRDVIVAGRDHPTPDKNALKAPRPLSWDRVATAKAAADFLRQYAGVRFLYPDLNPWAPVSAAGKTDFLASPAFEFLQTPAIAVPADLNVRKVPVIDFHIAYPGTGGFYDLATNRLPIVDEVFGGHTYERAVPVEKYKDTHPEYFALLGGKRSGGTAAPAQYCISNPDVKELIYRDLVGWIDRGYKAVDIGQPDGFRACQCDECKKLYGTGGDWNEKLWLFHRDLAARVHTERPAARVTIVSYIQTELPPKTFKAFPPNTAVMLTGTNEEDIAPWRAAEVPQGFTGYVYNWCPNLGTRYTPMRTPRYVEAQVKRLAANKIRSVYRDGFGSLFGLEGPVYYTMGRMFDDPEHNQAKVLVHEFCDGAFGKAAGPMVQFFDQLYHGVELYSEFLGTRNPAWAYQTIYGQRRKYLTDPYQFIGFLYTPALLNSLETQLAQAEKVAATDKVKARLALVRREFDYLKSMARVVHLYHAFMTQPDLASRSRLLDAIDARNAEIDAYFDARGAKPMPGGWAYTLFPPPGHDAKHLRLSHNGYQEPYANTAFNWDTKAMRTAPLPGTKRIDVAAAWDRAAPATFGGPPAKTPATAVRVTADATHVHVRVEADVPTGDTKGEALSVILAPVPGRELAYRFTVGPAADSKQDAALGLVTDPLDPRFGKFDTEWSGDWKYESKVGRTAWTATVSVPFKTLGVEPPKPGSFWRGNVARIHAGGERSVWSAAVGSKSADDPNDFGELAFPAADGPGKSSLQELREGLYRTSFDVPADWKNLPDPLPTPFGPWVFRKDQLDQGVKQKWFAGAAGSEWAPISVPAFWAESEAVGKHEGYGWYRTTFTPPAEWKGRPVRLLFGAVDEQAWVYVNGKLVREHSEKSEKKGYAELWDLPFAAEVPAEQIEYGKPNVLVVRVHNAAANGGIWRPVLCHAGKKP